MNPVHWLVQTDLGDTSNIAELLATLRAEGIAHTSIARHPPFSIHPPVVEGLDGHTVLVYGTTNLVSTVAAHRPWHPGVFFDPAQFTYSQWAKHYGEHLLNSPTETIQATLGQVAALDLPWDDLFVRPERDLKEFNGGVQCQAEFRAFATDVSKGGYPLIGADTPVVIGPPHGISAEWRVFITDRGEVLGASRYRWNGRTSWVRDVPEEVLAFAQARAREWSPAPVFVMDVARSGEGLYIVEAQCAHSAGLYAVELTGWVRGFSHAAQRWMADPPVEPISRRSHQPR